MKQKEIFVFGSNLAGIHGAGAALHAVKYHGAVRGIGVGLQGNSFAIPTKDHEIKTLPLRVVERYIDGFMDFAANHSEYSFIVTRVGCGLAGYEDKEIAPLFLASPDNCYFDFKWGEYLGDYYNYWGTF